MIRRIIWLSSFFVLPSFLVKKRTKGVRQKWMVYGFNFFLFLPSAHPVNPAHTSGNLVIRPSGASGMRSGTGSDIHPAANAGFPCALALCDPAGLQSGAIRCTFESLAI